jgi:hypothetical protein
MIMAHRWNEVDIMARLGKPIGKPSFIHAITAVIMGPECFYAKDGSWYYAGVYEAMRLEDLAPVEWETLSTEVLLSISKTYET